MKVLSPTLCRPQLIEIQTSGFENDGKQARPPPRVVRDPHRAPVTGWHLARAGRHPRRKSPKRGSIADLFDELVSVPTLLDHPNLTLDVVLVNVTKTQVFDPNAKRRQGGYRTVHRRLDDIVEADSFPLGRRSRSPRARRPAETFTSRSRRPPAIAATRPNGWRIASGRSGF
ncbi:MAG: hypothetical protein R2706_02660 [Acidimicrobiales bacterium]